MIAGAEPIALTSGSLKMSAYAMGRGPCVLCLHGFPDTPATFHKLLPALAAAGYRAVAVTMRGYEPRSQPADKDYSMAALAGDVKNWLDALGATRASLIGHDWGASIAYAAAALCPERISKLVAMAVPHPAAFAAALPLDFEQMRRSWYIFLFQLQGVAEGVIGARDRALLQELWNSWSPGWPGEASVIDAMAQAFAREGVIEASLTYYRAAFDVGHRRFAESQALLSAPISAPALGLCGDDDGCVSADVFEGSMPPESFIGGVTVKRIAAAGHFLHLERPDATHDAILAHLSD